VGSERVSRFLGIGANLAVLAGLIFVGLQVRDGRAAAEAQVADGIADGFLQLNLAGISDSEVACLWIVGLEHPERLTAVQSARFSLYLRGVFNQYQRVHRQFTTGLASEDAWSEIAREAAWLRSTPGGQAHFANNPLEPALLAAISEYEGQMEVKGMSLGKAPPEGCD
jgi:hypothetical protein